MDYIFCRVIHQVWYEVMNLILHVLCRLRQERATMGGDAGRS